MKKKIKIAFLGGGINSAVGRTHKIAIDMDERYELVAGCFSRDKVINLQTAEAYGVDENRLYSSLEDLVQGEKDTIDVIAILTPTPNHKEEVIYCIKNNLPVICEKALAVSSREALLIQETLEKYNGILIVTYNYTGYPMLRELRSLIQKNRLGKITQIHIEMPQESFIKLNINNEPVKPQDWRLFDKSLPTVSLDLGVHTHNIISFLTQEKPLEVMAIQNSYGSFDKVIDNSISLAKYSNNIVANIWYSKSALGHRNGLRVRIYGKLGSAEWYQLDAENLLFNDNKGKKTIIDRGSLEIDVATSERYNRFKVGHPSGFIEAFANYYYDAYDYLVYGNNKDRFVYGVNEALEGLEMLEAMSKSSKSGHWEKV